MSRKLSCAVVSPTPVPPDLLNAFWDYDNALLVNDLATMSALFMPGLDAVRGDGTNFLVGHDEIAGFRSSRSKIPTRQVEELHVRLLGDDAAVLLARTRDGDATGLQTQVWKKKEQKWLILVAHVTLPRSA